MTPTAALDWTADADGGVGWLDASRDPGDAESRWTDADLEAAAASVAPDGEPLRELDEAVA